MQDTQLDDGARLHIAHSDIGRGGHLLVTIRNSLNARLEGPAALQLTLLTDL